MVNGIWRETEVKTATNTAIAAAAIEVPITGTEMVSDFNSLLIVNTDIVDINFFLNGNTTDAVKVESGGSATLSPEEGRHFVSVGITNLDGATAMTAGKVTIRAAKAVREA